MARSKRPPEPKDDIPAWFMTYSDVITLLMTFFILLLTFATTEPERFEKSVSSMFANGSATGIAGKKMKTLEADSIANRIRVPAARIAMRGAEMPPIMKAPAAETWGEGLRSLNDDEAKQNELTSHHFDVPISLLFDSQNQLTTAGKNLARMLSSQLQNLPFRASLQFRESSAVEKVAEFMEYLFHTEMTRPGQVAMSRSRDPQLKKDRLRVVIERFSSNQQRNASRGG